MKIALLDDYADAWRQVASLARLSGHDVTVYRDTPRSADELVKRLADAEATVLIQQRSWLDAAILEQLPHLRFISQTGATTGHIDLDACERMGIVVSTGSRSPANATAEFAWGLILSSLRDIPRQTQRMKDGQWLDSIGTTLAGKTLGIYAFGRIGGAVARVGAAFDMRILCWGRESSMARARAAGFEVAPGRAAFFEQSDVLSLHLPLNKDTLGIVEPADLGRMKPGALLVNTSRSRIIAPGALHAALVAGRPGLAAVDVYDEEPVVDGSDPLLALPNVLCTPHLGYSTDDWYRAAFDTALDQLLAFAAGTPVNVVNRLP